MAAGLRTFTRDKIVSNRLQAGL